jgi:hypothetical protein
MNIDWIEEEVVRCVEEVSEGLDALIVTTFNRVLENEDPETEDDIIQNAADAVMEEIRTSLKTKVHRSLRSRLVREIGAMLSRIQKASLGALEREREVIA